jgi:hypothetical protein
VEGGGELERGRGKGGSTEVYMHCRGYIRVYRFLSVQEWGERA